jgi:hypothetical protein
VKAPKVNLKPAGVKSAIGIKTREIKSIKAKGMKVKSFARTIAKSKPKKRR